MTVVGIAVLVLFTISVAGLGLMLVLVAERPDERGGDEDGSGSDDEAWLAELRALNAAMPHVRKHRARVAARAGRATRDNG